MPFWIATAHFVDSAREAGTSEWAVEANSPAHAESMVMTSLKRDGLTPVDVRVRGADSSTVQSDLFTGVGTVTALREGPRLWGVDRGAGSVQLQTLDPSDGTGKHPEWIAPALWDALFAHHDGHRVYAVLDGSVWQQTGNTLAEALSDGLLPAAPLFENQATGADTPEQSEMRSISPWLVDLTLDPEQRDNPGRFRRQLFGSLWQTNIGIFLRSPTSPPDMRNRLRKLTKIRDMDDRWYYNRFWEPEFFLYFILFLRGRRLLAPLTTVSGFTVQIEGKIITAKTDLSSCADAPRDPESDIERLFNAGTAMVALRHARRMEVSYKRGLDPDHVYELAQKLFGLDGIDYGHVIKFIEICYVLIAFYGDRAAQVLSEAGVDECFDDEGGVTLQAEILHGRCMFGIDQNIAPGKLPQMGVY
ncbi:DUF4123 domain-containing protein [Paracoccus onubensis]|uniref:DUF4123 domain-containing protein n=1 Tax=Paracoccus onubensis TaxID=1675788 RepID=UPI002730F762|nr:DUF4123 domain-containing protein [Paracoccus onubensis]MDP0926555.1 DUF4123 domain-containing protein [Paracoccus onubensis]